MSLARTAAVVLLVALLAVNVAAANALVAADRTVLNAGFVTTTLEEEGAYEEVRPLVLEELPVDELETTDDETPPLPVDVRSVLAAAVDADYVQSQVEPNIERTYAYLHGETGELELIVDLEPAKAAIAAAVEAELTDATAAELLESIGDEQALSVEAQGFSLDLVTVAEMAEDEAVFRAEREALRVDVREQVVASFVDQAFDEATNDELLALVIEDYDPSDYDESEKEQLVADNEAEIRTALRERIEAEDDGEIDAAVDEALADTRESVQAEIAAAFDGSGDDLDPALEASIRDLLLVAVDGYLADVSHAEFSTEFEAAGDELAAGIASVVESELDEAVSDQVDLTEDLDPAAAEGLENAREVVGLIDLLALVLPLVGLGLIGGVFLVTRTVATTAIGAGVGLVIGGLPALVGAASLPGMLRDAVTDADVPRTVAELVPALAGQVADAVLLQSGIVVGLGVVALGAGLALHYELVEWPPSADGE